MIKTTGELRYNSRFFVNAELRLYPTFKFEGVVVLNVQIWEADAELSTEENEVLVQKDVLRYAEIDKSIFDGCNGNAHDYVIDKLEDYVISDLLAKNPECEFEKI